MVGLIIIDVMKSISNYLSEAVSRGKGNAAKYSSKFPKKLDANTIVEFLESNGFMFYDDSRSGYSFRRYAEDHHVPVFFYKNTSGSIRIKIYRPGDDHVFRIHYSVLTGKPVTSPGSFTCWVEKYPYGAAREIVYDTYKEFRESVIAHYNW